ncbi:MAG TPA: light-harvesting antenna LH1, beta subunit [Acidisphaera sp.]|nr:light-harvesting antenna LH1, beta subunit [Acidisphaera sp.]
MSDLPKRDASLSGLTEPEAREFHAIFMQSFAVFIIVAVIAHILAWAWRPWGVSSPTAFNDLHQHVSTLLTMIS